MSYHASKLSLGSKRPSRTAKRQKQSPLRVFLNIMKPSHQRGIHGVSSCCSTILMPVVISECMLSAALCWNVYFYWQPRVCLGQFIGAPQHFIRVFCEMAVRSGRRGDKELRAAHRARYSKCSQPREPSSHPCSTVRRAGCSTDMYRKSCLR